MGETLEYYANQVNGTRKRDEREDNQHDYFHGSEISDIYIEREFDNDKEFKNNLSKLLTKKLNKDAKVYYIQLGGTESPGAVLPSCINTFARISDEDINFAFSNPDKNHLRYSLEDEDFYKRKGFDRALIDELNNLVTAKAKNIAKILIKNKRLKAIRQMHRKNDPNRQYKSGTKKMYMEDYFPY